MEGLKVPNHPLLATKTLKALNPFTHKTVFEGLFLSVDRAGHSWQNIKLYNTYITSQPRKAECLLCLWFKEMMKQDMGTVY
uniref:Uncharacterized protein n=1 Tax=Tolypothrix bouteillei VB521301 TaxID=1479485 RepID=A0A0C1NBX6_9CYAN